MLKRFLDNEAGRDFVVGDVHGCLYELNALLAEVGFETELDRLFMTGNLIDYGPDSQGVLALLSEPWCHSVRGDHEDILLSVANDPTAAKWDWWEQNGGAWSDLLSSTELAKYGDLVRALPWAISVGSTGRNRFNIVHAEFAGNDRQFDTGHYGAGQESMLRGKSLFLGLMPKPGDSGLSSTYVGHCVVSIPMECSNHTFINTGCYKTGVLTMIEHATGDCWMTSTHEVST